MASTHINITAWQKRLKETPVPSDFVVVLLQLLDLHTFFSATDIETAQKVWINCIT